MPGARSKKVVQDGDTLLVDKSKIPAKYLEVPAKEINKLLTKPREKKPLSEKQQANLQRLIELNKKRREEKLAQMKVNVDDLGEIPEDKVVVKAVRKVGRPRKNQPKQDEEHEVVELPPKQPVLQREKKQVPRRPLSPPDPPSQSDTEEEEKEEKEPAKKPRRKIEKAGKIVDKKRSVVRSSSSRPSGRKPRYVSETSETETQADDEDSDDSDYEEERVKKYVAKTKARMEALKQIESQLKPQSKYAGMSIF